MEQSAGHVKDEILDRIAREYGNVAQFVSFSPRLEQRHAWIHGHPPNHHFGALEAALAAILTASPEGRVNIRSFHPNNPKGRPFLRDRADPAQIQREVEELAADGLYTILNETVDIFDGGVSGVAFGDVLEFAPEDTPRCVDQEGVASLPRDLGRDIFRTVYGFTPTLPAEHLRVEFSLHPLRRGFHHGHTILWEVEEVGSPPRETVPRWPNRFSRFMGDKAFGLLVAHCLGLPVPRTLVIPRKLAPFQFGADSGSTEVWIRTCPTEQLPGLFTTERGWRDPYALMQEEDPSGEAIASLLSQQSVEGEYSGALIAQADGEPLVEGVAGRGDDFMFGRREPEVLPEEVRSAVLDLARQAEARLGPVRFEWVYDGERTWVVQLHVGASATVGDVIFPGQADRYHRLPVADGIDALRELIARVRGTGEGIILEGRVGVTSHLGDLLRRAEIPSRLEPAAPEPATTG